MKLTIVADRSFVLARTKEMIKELEQSSREDIYDSVLEAAIGELVKIDMRESAYAETPPGKIEGGAILDRAAEQVVKDLHEASPHFDISPYMEVVEKQLRSPAGELAELEIRLRESKNESRIGEETIVRHAQPYLIKELGLRDAIEGVAVFPLGDAVEVDLDKLWEYTVEGTWFPFQIRKDNFTVILDDDGSLFVDTKYLSVDVLKKARQLLTNIADSVYSV